MSYKARLKETLKRLQGKNNQVNKLWKPKPGENRIRIVPNQYNKEEVFTELWFHYNKGKTALSLKTFNEPDPFIELGDELKAAGDKESYELSKEMWPKMRPHARILNRDAEKEGVKFWGFGKQIYMTLLEDMTDDEIGDITDPENGYDLIVTFTPPKKDQEKYPDYDGAFSTSSYGEVKVKVARKSTILTNDEELAEIIKNKQPKIEDLYSKPTYDELKTLLEKFLTKITSQTESDTKEETEQKSEPKKEESETDAKTEKKKASNRYEELFGK